MTENTRKAMEIVEVQVHAERADDAEQQNRRHQIVERHRAGLGELLGEDQGQVVAMILAMTSVQIIEYI
jgi:hypothetical protein